MWLFPCRSKDGASDVDCVEVAVPKSQEGCRLALLFFFLNMDPERIELPVDRAGVLGRSEGVVYLWSLFV